MVIAGVFSDIIVRSKGFFDHRAPDGVGNIRTACIAIGMFTTAMAMIATGSYLPVRVHKVTRWIGRGGLLGTVTVIAIRSIQLRKGGLTFGYGEAPRIKETLFGVQDQQQIDKLTGGVDLGSDTVLQAVRTEWEKQLNKIRAPGDWLLEKNIEGLDGLMQKAHGLAQTVLREQWLKSVSEGAGDTRKAITKKLLEHPDQLEKLMECSHMYHHIRGCQLMLVNGGLELHNELAFGQDAAKFYSTETPSPIHARIRETYNSWCADVARLAPELGADFAAWAQRDKKIAPRMYWRRPSVSFLPIPAPFPTVNR